jgi:hypothetical protein
VLSFLAASIDGAPQESAASIVACADRFNLWGGGAGSSAHGTRDHICEFQRFRGTAQVAL